MKKLVPKSAQEFCKRAILSWEYYENDTTLSVLVHGAKIIGPDEATEKATYSRPALMSFNLPCGGYVRAAVWGWGDPHDRKYMFPFVSIELLARLVDEGKLGYTSARQWVEVMGRLEAAFKHMQKEGKWRYECPHDAWPPELLSPAERRFYRPAGDYTPIYRCGGCGMILD